MAIMAFKHSLEIGQKSGKSHWNSQGILKWILTGKLDKALIFGTKLDSDELYCVTK